MAVTIREALITLRAGNLKTYTHARTHARTHRHARTHAHPRTHARTHTQTHTHTHTNPVAPNQTGSVCVWGGGIAGERYVDITKGNVSTDLAHLVKTIPS